MRASDADTPLRVLHVFATFVPAGPQVRAVALIEGLGPGFRHTVVATDDELGALELIPAECEVVSVPAPSGGGLDKVRAWRRILREQRPDLLLTYNWGSFDAVLAARSLGLTAHVHHEDGFNADEAGGQLKRRIWARRMALGRVACVVVPSRGLQTTATRDWRVDPERVRLVVNGVRTDRFHPDEQGREEIRTRLGLEAGDLLIGTVGHLRPVKRFDRMLRAMALLRETDLGKRVHLCLVGDGPMAAALKDLTEELELADCVHWAGHQTDLTPWYAAMDLFCLSSDSEQLPVSLLEAMSTGLAVASTDVGDIGVTLPEEGRGALVDMGAEGRTAALAEAAGHLLADGERRATLGAANLKRVQADFSHGTMVETYRALYLEAAGR